ncbi:MAG TPA: YfhO family protein [Thermomicrobiales bacterium]|nr:YfhO family protein [Thermomicrobiales bacterium]
MKETIGARGAPGRAGGRLRGPRRAWHWPGWGLGVWAALVNGLLGLRARYGAAVARWAARAGQAATLVAVAVAVLWPAPITADELPGVFPIGWQQSDLLISHWPAALLLKRTVAEAHRLPLWNPYYGGGRPLAADPLAALFYPPTQLVNLFPLRDYFLAIFLGHLLLAGLGMLLLARVALRLPRLPALLAAVAFMATPRLIGHVGAGHVTMVQAVAWLPWLALAAWATARRPARWWPALAACLALLLLAGHPQVAYYGGLLLVGLAVWLLARRWRALGRRAALAAALGLGAAGVAGVCLAAVHLLPLMEFTARSTRQLAVPVADAYPLPDFFRALVGIMRPSKVPHEDILTPGLAVLPLVALGVAARWRKGLPLLLAVVLAAGLAMGQASPLYHLAARVLPDFDKFRGLSRIWFLGLLPLALLAGLGADALLAGIRRFSARGALVAGLLVLLVVGVDLVHTDQPYNHVATVRPEVRQSDLAREAATIAGSGRIYGVQRNLEQLGAVTLDARLADAWDPLLIESYAQFMQRAGGYTFAGYQLAIPPYEVSDPGYPTSTQAQPDATLLGLLHVSVVLSRYQLTDPRFMEVGQRDGAYIYQNLADAGPAYLVLPAPDGAPPAIATLSRLTVPVRADQPSPERATFTFTAPSDAYLVIADPAYPGWVANLDGHPVRLDTLDGALPAVRVGPGQHTVTYAYEPRSLYLGAALALLALLAALGWVAGYAVWARRRARDRSQRQPLPV